MPKKGKTRDLALSAILTAFGILIPIVMPFKITLDPASYTLASHVPIFIAVFISPRVAVSVAMGSSFGFFLASFPPLIVARSLTHLIFALVGALILKKAPKILGRPFSIFSFAVLLNLLHAFCEVLVVYGLTSAGQLSASYWYTLLVLIGIGTVIHGLIDFYLSLYIWKVIPKH